MKTKQYKDFILESYDSVEDFNRVITTRGVSNLFEDCDLSSQTGSENFTKTKNFEEAAGIMQKGYKEGLDQIKKVGKMKVTKAHVAKQLPQTGIVGFTPHVPNAIAGIPQSMISTQRIQMKSKVINIMYACTCGAYVPASNIAKAGRNLLDLIVSLESQGYRVQLDMLLTTCTKKQQVGALIKVKDHRQQINPLKLAYMLVHPSFFRRHGFLWIETVPNLTDKKFTYDYGTSLTDFKGGINNSVKFLKDIGILTQGTFFTNINQGYKVSSAEELGREMGIITTKK